MAWRRPAGGGAFCCWRCCRRGGEAPRRTRFAALPDWPGEDRGRRAARPSCELPGAGAARAGRRLGGAEVAGPRGRRPTAPRPAPSGRGPAGRCAGFLERHFQPQPVGPGLLTGYYEPELRGAPRPGRRLPVPLRAPAAGWPAAAARPRGHRGRARWPGRALELAWVDDPVDAFFLQIQGSGRIGWRMGGLLRLGYAGQNGHPYLAIGRSLIAARRHRAGGDVDAGDPRLAGRRPARGGGGAAAGEPGLYLLPPDGGAGGRTQGPLGTLGVPLTPGRSLAVDPAFIPLGAPVFAGDAGPAGRHAGPPAGAWPRTPAGRSAAPGRGDLFWGWGEAAAARAGPMREAARLVVLLPRPAP